MTGSYTGLGLLMDTFHISTKPKYSTQDIYLLEFDNDGNTLMGKAAGGSNSDGGTAIATGINSCVYIAGSTISLVTYFDQDSVTIPGTTYNMFIAKLNYGKGTTAIQSLYNTSPDVVIYPNPTNSMLRINSKDIIYKTEVYNLAGALVIQATNTADVDVSPLQSGMYFIKVYSKDGDVVLKFVKE